MQTVIEKVAKDNKQTLVSGKIDDTGDEGGQFIFQRKK